MLLFTSDIYIRHQSLLYEIIHIIYRNKQSPDALEKVRLGGEISNWRIRFFKYLVT
jgi:hypothetical protein